METLYSCLFIFVNQSNISYSTMLSISINSFCVIYSHIAIILSFLWFYLNSVNFVTFTLFLKMLGFVIPFPGFKLFTQLHLFSRSSFLISYYGNEIYERTIAFLVWRKCFISGFFMFTWTQFINIFCVIFWYMNIIREISMLL